MIVCCPVKMILSMKVEFLYTRSELDSLSHTIRILSVGLALLMQSYYLAIDMGCLFIIAGHYYVFETFMLLLLIIS